MPFFNGVSTDASAYPLNATDIANQINLLFANPNGMVSFLLCCMSSVHLLVAPRGCRGPVFGSTSC